MEGTLDHLSTIKTDISRPPFFPSYDKLVARTTTKLTPAQLEEFESTFRHFDKDQTNTLGLYEFSAALSALGIIYSDEDTLSIHQQLAGATSKDDRDGRIDFQTFIEFLVRGGCYLKSARKERLLTLRVTRTPTCVNNRPSRPT